MLGAVSHLSKIQLHVVLDKHLIETASVTFLLLGWNVVPQSTVREFVLAHSCRGLESLMVGKAWHAHRNRKQSVAINPESLLRLEGGSITSPNGDTSCGQC